MVADGGTVIQCGEINSSLAGRLRTPGPLSNSHFAGGRRQEGTPVYQVLTDRLQQGRGWLRVQLADAPREVTDDRVCEGRQSRLVHGSLCHAVQEGEPRLEAGAHRVS